jgi:hypothetical protein
MRVGGFEGAVIPALMVGGGIAFPGLPVRPKKPISLGEGLAVKKGALTFVILAGAIMVLGNRAIQERFASFTKEDLHTRFVSFATEILGSQRLQFATLRQNELFERTSEASLFWGKVPLPEVVVSATVPVEYTYFLDLKARWLFQESGTTLMVIAPTPDFNEPAADLSHLEFQVKKGSFFRREDPVMESLKAELMALLRVRARENVSLVRETGRGQTEGFIRNWLGKANVTREVTQVRVRFADEPRDVSVAP